MAFEREKETFNFAFEQIYEVMCWANDFYFSAQGELLSDETIKTLLPFAFEMWKEFKNNGL